MVVTIVSWKTVNTERRRCESKGVIFLRVLNKCKEWLGNKKIWGKWEEITDRWSTYGFKLCWSRYLQPWISRQMTSTLFHCCISLPARQGSWRTCAWAVLVGNHCKAKQFTHTHTPPDTESRSKKYTLLQKQKENKYSWHCSEMEYLTAAL